MDSNNATFEQRTKGGHVFVGGDQDIFRARLLASSLSIYASTGMRPTRRVGPTLMLKLASQYTGKAYKRGEYAQAVADLTAHCRWLASQPNTNKPLPRFPA